jgi:ADP-dependent NAD(P)H-hydrate dehydratase / NAD(P)H-hydrate epimerase
MPNIISKKIMHSLRTPKPGSRKRENGRLLMVAGFDPHYFGAMVFALKTASRLVDLVYLLASKPNTELATKLKLKVATFMQSKNFHEPQLQNDIDCILIGPGMGISPATKKLTLDVLKSKKKAVLDADSLNVLDDKLKKFLSPLHILTPHHREFYRLFKLKASPEHAAGMAQKYHCTIILKGPTDVIASPNGKISLNKTGNAGMTKGGTGDVLAGLVAALYATNDTYTAAAAGCYLNGAAGDDLYKKVGAFYNAEDLAEQIPITINKLVNSNK